MRKDRIDTFGAVLLVGFSALLGLNQSLVKIVNGGMEPFFQAGLRSLCGAIVVVTFCAARGRSLRVPHGTLLPGLVSGTFFALEFALLFNAVNLTSVSRASVLFYTMPVWLAVAAHFLLGERLTPTRILGLCFAVAGVACALLWNAEPASDYAIWGDLMCLLGAGFWMGIAVLARASRLSVAEPHVQLLFQLLVSAPILIGLAAIPGTFAFGMTPTLWGIFAVTVFAVGSFGFLLWFWILSIYPASDMASFSFLAPVFGVIFGWAILGETVGWNVVAALIMVGVGLVLINRRRDIK